MYKYDDKVHLKAVELLKMAQKQIPTGTIVAFKEIALDVAKKELDNSHEASDFAFWCRVMECISITKLNDIENG